MSGAFILVMVIAGFILMGMTGRNARFQPEVRPRNTDNDNVVNLWERR